MINKVIDYTQYILNNTDYILQFLFSETITLFFHFSSLPQQNLLRATALLLVCNLWFDENYWFIHCLPVRMHMILTTSETWKIKIREGTEQSYSLGKQAYSYAVIRGKKNNYRNIMLYFKWMSKATVSDVMLIPSHFQHLSVWPPSSITSTLSK